MPRCYFVKKPIQQYSNFTILKSGETSTMAMPMEEHEKLVNKGISSTSASAPTSVIVAISSPQVAPSKAASPSQVSTGLCQYICAAAMNGRDDSHETRNGKWFLEFLLFFFGRFFCL